MELDAMNLFGLTTDFNFIHFCCLKHIKNLIKITKWLRKKNMYVQLQHIHLWPSAYARRDARSQQYISR